MNNSETFDLTPQRCVKLLVERRWVWIVPALACGLLSFVYAIFMTRYWEAFQGMVVREEASVSAGAKQPGKFADLYEMRTFQETILELAKSHQVISATLKNVDLAEGQPATEPDAEQIEKFRKRLSMSPPNGAEFGKTEIFYFGMKDPSRERAIALVGEMCKQLSLRLSQLRQERSQGLINDLEKQVELSAEIHQAENAKLKEFEAQVGSDLGELRILHSAMGGQSDLRQQLVELEKESRAVEARLREAEDLLIVLQGAQDNPQKLVGMPGSLLKIQPTLQRLKDGLVDAQLQVSKLSGTRTAEHPHVRAAQETVVRIRTELHRELAVVVEGLQVDVGLSHNRLEVLNSQIDGLKTRLNGLAELRAEYSSRVASVDSSRAILSEARKQLSEVRAKQVAAASAQLVTPIDSPETGPYPVGMGRTTVVMLGTFAGMVLGLGWLFLSLPTAQDAKQKEPETVAVAEAPPVTKPVAPRPTTAGFDFSSYTKKLREANPALAGHKVEAAKPNVVLPLGSGSSFSSPTSVGS